MDGVKVNSRGLSQERRAMRSQEQRDEAWDMLDSVVGSRDDLDLCSSSSV
jgi:hypothetical protein